MAAHIGRRLRRGAASTAIAAVAMAALTASQAPGTLPFKDPDVPAGAPSDDHPIDGGSPYHTELPPLQTPDKPGASIDLPGAGDPDSGIPATVLAAYKRAEASLADTNPGCNLPWELLAAIGKVESGQAGGGAVDAEGTTLKPILGPQLNGNGFANISDTDGGTYDNDTVHDRAVGPMQFIPETWMRWGADGNGDGAKDPNNIYDAALAAGRYLCAGNRDLSEPADLEAAILGYNRSREYLRTVLSWLEFYRKGTHEVPDGTGVLPRTPGAGASDGGGAGGSGGRGGSQKDDSGPGDGKDNGSGKQRNEDPGKGSGGKDDETGTPTPSGSPTATATGGGTISPGGSPSSSASSSPSASPSQSQPEDEESTPPAECPTESVSPSPSGSSGSASPTPTPSGSGSPSASPSGEPGDDPCADEDAGEQKAPEPEPSSSTGSVLGAALARLTSF
ncbi:lytic transglycosylase domain-containing protein [Streptomyces xinghaiensis]|uniref:lytic transglycosylase domain-containing protein n=1 Tax=Streptomyces xinghaiensis TaxID=1038928 RepID=UPI002E15DC8C|nr:lytic transglycosylase domain-containing protein [Streptomyces xinghaiensis]